MTEKAVAAEAVPSQIMEFWYFFRQNRGAVVGLAVVLFFIVLAIFAPFIAPHDPALIHDGMLIKGPFWTDTAAPGFFLGTDDVGRDLLSRLIYGARISITVGFMVVVVSLTIGTLLGLLAGYAGGWVDTVVMRMTDILMALPSILLAIVVVTILGHNLTNAILAVSVTVVPGFVRLVRAQVMVEKGRQYVIAARSFGAGPLRQVFSNILPNCMAPIIVQGALGFSGGILSVAALGFLGLGAKPPTAEWGTMLSDTRSYIESAPWLVTLPGLCILVLVLGFNMLGDGLRDALDPRLKK